MGRKKTLHTTLKQHKTQKLFLLLKMTFLSLNSHGCIPLLTHKMTIASQNRIFFLTTQPYATKPLCSLKPQQNNIAFILQKGTVLSDQYKLSTIGLYN